MALSAGGGIEGAGDGEEAREGGELTRSTPSSTARDGEGRRRRDGPRTATAGAGEDGNGGGDCDPPRPITCEGRTSTARR